MHVDYIYMVRNCSRVTVHSQKPEIGPLTLTIDGIERGLLGANFISTLENEHYVKI